jgi:hypothetical protein
MTASPSALDKLGSEKNMATQALARMITSEVKAGHSLHLMAHSQGCLILGVALDVALRDLSAAYGPAEARGRMRRLVKVEAMASPGGTWPEGPQYRHYINLCDPVARCPQTPRRPDSDHERTIAFSERSSPHHIGTYLKHRQPF